MSGSELERGGAALAALSHMEAWEANLVLNLRLWCQGPDGQHDVCAEFRRELPLGQADQATRNFDCLIRDVCENGHRRLVRHEVTCNCVGADECVFLHLVRTASAGHLTDAALISSLLVGPAHAERIALLAGEVGTTCRQITRNILAPGRGGTNPETTNVVRLH